MMPVPVLSIVIPYFSTPDQDRRAMLDRLLATIPDRAEIEVIVVDDHSVPALEVAERPKHSRFCLTRSPRETRFAGHARNHGISLARGRFLLHADSDDVFVRLELDEMVERLALWPAESPFTVFLMQPMEVSVSKTGSETRSLLYGSILDAPDVSDPAKLLMMGWHAPWAKIYPRRAQDGDLRFREDHIVDDAMFSAKLALLAEHVERHLPISYAVYRGHGAGALTARPGRTALRARIAAVREVNTMLLDRGRGDLRIPLHHAMRQALPRYPGVAITTLISGLMNKEPVLPTKLRKGTA